jgi:hypothetical protein
MNLKIYESLDLLDHSDHMFIFSREGRRERSETERHLFRWELMRQRNKSAPQLSETLDLSDATT